MIFGLRIPVEVRAVEVAPDGSWVDIRLVPTKGGNEIQWRFTGDSDAIRRIANDVLKVAARYELSLTPLGMMDFAWQKNGLGS